MSLQSEKFEIVGYFRQAIAEEIGIELRFASHAAMVAATKKFYKVRAEIPEFQCVSLFDKGDCMWLMKTREHEDPTDHFEVL